MIISTTNIYLVGGAVRDQLLGLAVKDRDWLIVGATPEQLLAQGYQQVGNDFPVFLHPKTKEEYALARTERKNGNGYNGFICDFTPEVTLEQDLIRRDLTINAIAQDLDGNYHDFYGGIADLKHRLLRHVSPAFAEDPLRVLRVARFAARFHSLGFRIAPETVKLMQEMTACGELAHLTAERVWQETQKAFATDTPHIYFQVLREVGALKVLFPEVEALFGVPQPEKYHPEIDSGVHTLMVLEQAKKLAVQANDPESVLFAALCHDLGKALTPKDILPHHYGHEQKGVAPTKQLANRLKVQAHTKAFAKLVTEFHTHSHKITELRPETVVKLFNKLDVWRKPERFFDFLLVCEADSKGRLGFENREYPQADYAKQLYQVACEVDIQAVINDGFEKAGIKREIDHRRQLVILARKEENLNCKKPKT
ncbi:multifunctional CCA addition/repair protein [Glaesserella parasuis]|nr:multifunctional CCA addition/repair protein [Glaesserella parasuis]